MRLVCARLTAGLMFSLLPLLPAWASDVGARQPFPLVSVSGEGRVSVRPDLAQALAGVSTEGKTPRAAADANARAMTAVIAAAKQAGIAEEDIRTSGFAIHPVHAQRSREGAPEIVGYRVANMVQVKVRDTSRLGEVLDRLVGAGATNIAGVHFAASEPSKHLDEARAAAFADAKRKAELYAQAAGARVGRAVSISEEMAAVPRPRTFQSMEAAVSAPSTPTAPGEETLRVHVTVSFELLQ